MKHDISESEKQESLQRVDQQIFKLLEFLDTTLQWTRTNFENTGSSISEANLFTILSPILSLYHSQSSQKQLEIKVQVEPGADVFKTDPGIFSIIVRNIVSNAIKFTPDRGLVTVKASSTGTSFTLAVTNSGEGISSEKIAGIRSQQYKSEPGTYGEKGLGLGLKLCFQLLEKINGHLEISSTPDSTTFSVVLPQQ